jgi:O-antigen/teichoic acid export membrane protein
MTQESPQDGPARRAIGARHFLGTFVTTIALHGFALVQGVILARVLGADGRGEFAAIILWPGIIANIGLLGTNLSVTRAAAAARDDVGPVARAGVLLSLMLLVVAVAAGLGLLPLLIPEDSGDIMGLARTFMLWFVPAYMLSAHLAGVDQGQGRFRRLNFFRLLQTPVNVLFLVLLILLGQANLTHCVWALLAAYWVAALGRLAMLGRQVSLLGAVASLRTLLRQGRPFALAVAFQQLNVRADRILLLWLLADRDLGLYAVAFSAAAVLADAPRSMGIVSLTIAAQERPREGFARVAQIFRAAAIASLGMGVILSAAIYLLLPLVYGWDFADARVIGMILAAGFIPLGLTALLSQTMRGQGRPLVGMFSRMLGMAVMVPMAIVLSDSLRAAGIACAFLAAQTVTLCCMLLLTVRHYRSASLAAMVPRVDDARQLFRRLRQQVGELLARFGIMSPPAPVLPDRENGAECGSAPDDRTA